MTSIFKHERIFDVIKAAMDSQVKKESKSEKDDGFNATTEQMQSDMFNQVREVSHLVVKARMQAKEADIRARYATEFAERAVSEAQLAHVVASTLAKTARVVASMALEFANNISLDTSGDGDYLTFSLPESNPSLQSGDSFGDISFNASFNSPLIGGMANPLRNPRRRSPKCSPTSTAQKHETTYPDDLSPEDSLCDLLDGSKSLPTVWEDSYSNGWESTPERWADKKVTLQMLRKIQSKKHKKYHSDVDQQLNLQDDETQTTEPVAEVRDDKTAVLGIVENAKSTSNNLEASSEIMIKGESDDDKAEHVSSDTNTLSSASMSSSEEMFTVNGFGLDQEEAS